MVQIRKIKNKNNYILTNKNTLSKRMHNCEQGVAFRSNIHTTKPKYIHIERGEKIMANHFRLFLTCGDDCSPCRKGCSVRPASDRSDGAVFGAPRSLGSSRGGTRRTPSK